VRVLLVEDDKKLAAFVTRGLRENGCAVDVFINKVREKVDRPFGGNLIRTVRGVGYVLRSEETQRDAPS